MNYLETEDRARIEFKIVRTTWNPERTNKTVTRKKAYFQVPKEYGEYLVWDRCDAIVTLFLHDALSNRYNITSDIPMSSDLYYNIVECLLPMFVKNGEYNIKIKTGVVPPLEPGRGVGTGLSCGVDSLHSVLKYWSYPLEDHRLTHLCIFDVGAFWNYLYWRVGGDNVRDKAYERARSAASEIGLPLIETESNVAKTFALRNSLMHSFSSAFAVMCLKKLWRIYYFASAGEDLTTDITLRNWYLNVPATYEALLYRDLSTAGLRFILVGEVEDRIQKLEEISDFGVARNHLFSCSWHEENCGTCGKCIRNLTTLDAIGKLENFSNVYDLDHYRANRRYHMQKVYEQKSDPFFAPVYDMLMARGDPVLAECAEIGAATERFDELWGEDTPESCREAVEAISPYLGRAVGPDLRMAGAYKAGKGVKKSREKYLECLERCRARYQAEVDAGFYSEYQLWDVLWMMKTRDEDLLPTLKFLVDHERPDALIRLAKMYIHGRGVEKDVEKARDALVRASAKQRFKKACDKLLSKLESVETDVDDV